MQSRTTTFTIKSAVFTLLAIFFAFALYGCSESSDSNPSGNGGGGGTVNGYLLIIENGAVTIAPDKALAYTVKLVDKDGNITTPTNVTWTSSNTDIATVAANGAVTIKGQGIVTVKASVAVTGGTVWTEVPLRITVPELFAVVPPGIIMVTGEKVPLTPVFFSAGGTITYSYSSDKTGVATVNANGEVTGVGAGLATIEVTATNKNNAKVYVPVMVIGVPEVVLPVVRVKLNPPAADIFKGDQVTFTAKAYNSSNAEVSETFVWTSDSTDVATVSASGVVTAVGIGETTIRATTKGITGTAIVTVSPDTVVIVTPFWAELNPGDQQQFTAKAYNARTGAELTGITSFNWWIPKYSDVIPGVFDFLDIGTVDQNGLFTMKQDAMVGLTTVVFAWVPGNEESVGGAMVIVKLPFGGWE